MGGGRSPNGIVKVDSRLYHFPRLISLGLHARQLGLERGLLLRVQGDAGGGLRGNFGIGVLPGHVEEIPQRVKVPHDPLAVLHRSEERESADD